MKDLKSYESVKRWLNQVFADGVRSSSTEALYLHFLGRLCKFAGKDPDALIAERREHMRSIDEIVKRQHEELLINFRNYLEGKEGLARSSVVTASNVIKSFYVGNFEELKVKSPTSWPATKRKVPTPEDLARMIGAVQSDINKAVIICLAQSGLSLKDFLGVTYGVIKRELDEGITPLHLNMRRSKVMKEFDTFLGSDSIRFLKPYLARVKLEPEGLLFPISGRSVQIIVKGAGQLAGLKPHVTPHKLRSFFNTYMVLSFHGSQSQHIPIVDYWMGHVLPYGGAYMVPPVDGEMTHLNPETGKVEVIPCQREIYRAHEFAISLPR